MSNDELLFRLARTRLNSCLERGGSLPELEEELRGVPGLSEDWRSALWLYAWLLSPEARAGADHLEPAAEVAPVRRAPARTAAVLGVVGRVVATAAAALVPPWPF